MAQAVMGDLMVHRVRGLVKVRRWDRHVRGGWRSLAYSSNLPVLAPAFDALIAVLVKCCEVFPQLPVCRRGFLPVVDSGEFDGQCLQGVGVKFVLV
jgi:hypothetical protein